MRKIVVSTFISLDGIMEDPGGSESYVHGGWTVPYWNDQTARFKESEMVAADGLLLGRVTYEAFAGAWEHSTAEGSDHMNGLAKYVASRSLEQVTWRNSHLLQGELTEAVSALKRQPGKDLLVYGSASLVNALMAAGLVDEFRLLVYPVILGTGKRLFQEGGDHKLQIVESQAFSTGVQSLVYAMA